jgi:hypothetical protein
VVTIQAAGLQPEGRRLEGPIIVGGSPADGIVTPGLPPGALRLEARPAGILLAPAVAGLRVAGHAVTVGSTRLLRPGERAVLRGVSLEVVLEEPCVDTRVAAAALLREAAAGACAPTLPHLVVLTGPDAGRRLPLGDQEVLGRGRGASLSLADPRVSRRHVRLRLVSGGATIEDLGAKNGVRLNGVRIERRALPISPADEITLGDTTLALSAPVPGATKPCAANRSPRRREGISSQPLRARRRLRAPLVAAALLALSAAALALAG